MIEMVSSNNIILTGFGFVMLGIVLIFLGTLLQPSNTNNKGEEVQTAGVVLIGPIPIIFGNDKGLIIFAVIFAVVLMILSYLLFYRGFG